MPYIDSNYYLETYKGKPLDVPTDLDRLIQRASTRVKGMINHKVTPETLLDAPLLHQTLLKQATAELVEHYASNGLFVTKKAGGLKSASVGSFNYTVEKESTISKVSESVVPFNVIDTLSQTGLLYAGIDTTGGY